MNSRANTKKATVAKGATIYRFPGAKVLILLSLILLMDPTAAQHKCRDVRGAIAYQDTPCVNSIEVSPPVKPHQRESLPAIGSKAHIDAVAADLERQVDKKVEELAKQPYLNRPAPVRSSASESSKDMPFDQCVLALNRTAGQAGIAGNRVITIVNTSELVVRRICTIDSSVLVTCSGPDNKMLTQASSTGC